MTPLPSYTYQGLTDMAHREAVGNAPAPNTRIDEPVPYEEFMRQLRFATEAMKAEISQHCDDEIARFKAKIKEIP